MKQLKQSFDEKSGGARRRFLKGVKGAALAGATLGAGAAVARTLGETPQPATPGDGEKRNGYRETEHIRAYYRSARF